MGFEELPGYAMNVKDYSAVEKDFADDLYRDAAEEKTKTLESRLRTAETQLAKEKAESSSAKMNAGISVLGSILKSIFGRKSGFGGLGRGASTSSVAKATTAYK
jgi:hypothetical protein